MATLNPNDRTVLIEFAQWMLSNTEVDEYHQNKRIFRQRGKRVLRIIADALDMADDSYDVTFNLGGPAVSGDLNLHNDHINIFFNADHLCNWITYRACNGRREFTGGVNQQCYWRDLYNDPDRCIDKMRLIYKASKMVHF